MLHVSSRQHRKCLVSMACLTQQASRGDTGLAHVQKRVSGASRGHCVISMSSFVFVCPVWSLYQVSLMGAEKDFHLTHCSPLSVSFFIYFSTYSPIPVTHMFLENKYSKAPNIMLFLRNLIWFNLKKKRLLGNNNADGASLCLRNIE